MGGSGRVNGSLRTWLHSLPANVLTRYALELRDFDRTVSGVSPAIELVRSELRERENASVAAETLVAATEGLDARIQHLMDHCRAHRDRNADVLSRSQRAIDRLETALGYAELTPVR